MENNKAIITLESDRLGYGKVILRNPHHISIFPGITVIYGENGSGKTTLGTILEKGRYAYGNRIKFVDDSLSVKMISFTDIHSLSGMEVQYYAQRMEATMNDYVPTVGDIMKDRINLPLWNKLTQSLALYDVCEKKINYLSSGELRKLLIINALLENPDLLIIDNPYIGLDAHSREEVNSALQGLSDDGVSVLLLISDRAEIPPFTDSIIEMKGLEILTPLCERNQVRKFKEFSEAEFDILPELPERTVKPKNHTVSFGIKNGHIQYGNKEIVNKFNWEVRKGEAWQLYGQNGSGKSLLLSLVCADNPQAYSNDITIFDKKRGSGESIWEIKDAIGYVSPEMQLYFKSNSNIREIIVQGMRNSLNRYKPVTEDEKNTADKWMEILNISNLAEKRFTELSSGEQRLVMLARAFIKQPELLVLDEPLHGLDHKNKKRIMEITDRLTRQNGTSLIYVTHYDSELPDCITYKKSMSGD